MRSLIRRLNPALVFVIIWFVLLIVALIMPEPAKAAGHDDPEDSVSEWSPGQHRDWEFIGANQDAFYWFATQNRGAWLGVTLKVGERSPDGQVRTVRLIELLVQCQADHHAPQSAGFLGIASFDYPSGTQLNQYVSPDIGGTPVRLVPSAAFGQAADAACQEQGQQ
jgi:hypothetical protein